MLIHLSIAVCNLNLWMTIGIRRMEGDKLTSLLLTRDDSQLQISTAAYSSSLLIKITVKPMFEQG